MRTASAKASPPLSTFEERWITLDGARMRYLCGGSGPALVLVHGLLGYSFSWRYAMPLLAEHATVYALDMLGTGYSERPLTLDCCLRASAQRLLRFLENAQIPCCDLLGTSHGGAVAMMAAALSPERVRRMILVAPVNPWSAHGKLLAPLLSNGVVSPFLLHFARAFAGTHGIFFRRLFGDPRRIRPGALAGYAIPLNMPGSLEYGLKVLRSWNRDLDELERLLPRIAQVPTLLVWGESDRAVNRQSVTRLSRCFEKCRLLVFEGVGHLPYEEVPDDFNSAMLQFLMAQNQ